MITSISSINTAKESQNIAHKRKSAANKFSFINGSCYKPSFNGYLYNLVKNSEGIHNPIYRKKEQEEDELKKKQFLSEDASFQYYEAKKLAQNIKDEVKNLNIHKQNNEQYRQRLTDGERKSIVTANYSSDKNGISINKIKKLYANGSFDLIEFDKTGNPSVISKGIVPVFGEGTLISERFFFGNGILEKVQLGLQINRTGSFITKEVTFDNSVTSKILPA